MYQKEMFANHSNNGDIMDEGLQGSVLTAEESTASGRKFYIESYGCQMNFNDSEIVASILRKEGFSVTDEILDADIALINTCSIREKAEDTVRKRLQYFRSVRKQNPDLMIGVLGCMAERLKKTLLEQEKLVDLVVGPDAYRDLPNLINKAEDGNPMINVLLSREETYADISPVRLDSNGVSAFISIMRGCNNMCSFCVVPFTRGRERSRDIKSIIQEATDLFDQGYREVTLLGQNVDSYKYLDEVENKEYLFSDLLIAVAAVDPRLRVRFSTSHPKDITDDVLMAIANHDNICKYIHLPVQSGSSRILDLMNRTYDRDWYKSKIDRIYELIPDCAISSDIITGFCTETEEDHQDTLSMMEYSRYTLSYMFHYSERPGTPAAKKFLDDVPQEVKSRRLKEVIELQQSISLQSNAEEVGNFYEVLVEGHSKKSTEQLKGRNSQNKMVIFEKAPGVEKNQYVKVKIVDFNSATLFGTLVSDHE